MARAGVAVPEDIATAAAAHARFLRLAGTAGAALPDVAISAGNEYPVAKQTGVQDPALRALAGGVGQTVLDFLPLFAGEKYLSAAGKGGFGAMVKGAVTGAPVVGALTSAQQIARTVMGRAAAGQSLADPAAISSYINAAVGGLLPGMLGGAVFGAHRALAPEERVIPPAPQVVPAVVAPEPALSIPAVPSLDDQHAALVAQHDAAVQQVSSLETETVQTQQAHDAAVARLGELKKELAAAPAERRAKSAIIAERAGLQAQVKTTKAHLVNLDEQWHAARDKVADLAPKVADLATQVRNRAAAAAVPEGLNPAIGERPAPVESDIIQDPNAPVPPAPDQIQRAVTGVRSLMHTQGVLDEGEAGRAAHTASVALEGARSNLDAASKQVNDLVVVGASKDDAPPELRAQYTAAMSAHDAAQAAFDSAYTHANEANQRAATPVDENAAPVEPVTSSARETKVYPNEQTRQGAVETAGVRAAEPAIKELVGAKQNLTEGAQAKLTAVLTNAVHKIVQDAAAKPSTEGARAYLLAEIPKVLKGRVPAVDADQVARTISDAVDQAHTLYSKAAVGDTTPGVTGALTEAEFTRLPEPARAAAIDEFNRVYAAHGEALIGRVRQLVGNDPSLEVKTFTGTPDTPTGTYTRVGPLKSIVWMALNARHELSIADHEAYHYAEDRLLAYHERQIVANAFKDGRPLLKQLLEKTRAYDRENRTNITDEIRSNPVEARAYGFEFWQRGELIAEGALARVWQKLADFFEKVGNFVKGRGFKSVEDIFTAFDRGQFAERTRGDGGIGELTMGLASEAARKAWYRSELNRQVEGLPMKSAPAKGWKDSIKGLLAKGLVKQVELDAVGLDDFLDLHQGKMTKDQVMSFLRENGVRVEEVVKEGNATRFAGYQLPGGKNYREMLLTLPHEAESEGTSVRAERLAQESGVDWNALGPNGRQRFYDEADRLHKNKEAFYAGHFDEANILAHVRFNDRIDAEGKRVLFLEELQSDWAQKGRKEGFIAPPSNVPSAPFVTETEAWVSLALKRMIRYAAEGGYDRVAWTRGDQQVARYNEALRKQVDHIEWKKTPEGVHLVGRKGGQRVVDTIKHENVVSDAIGKSMADKIKNDPAESGVIEGDNISIADTGMAGFYDRIMPSVANKVLKKLGGDHVADVQVGENASPKHESHGWVMVDRADNQIYGPMPSESALLSRYVVGRVGKQLGFDMTPELAMHAAEGLPLFSKAALDMKREYEAGALERQQFNDNIHGFIDHAGFSLKTLTDAFGPAAREISGGAKRWWLKNIATGMEIARHSLGHANVQKALLAYVHFRNTLITRGAREGLSAWHEHSTSEPDIRSVGKVLQWRDESGAALDSPELHEQLATLSPHQRTMFDQATKIVAEYRRHDFAVEQNNMQKNLSPQQFAEWAKARGEQVEAMIAAGQMPRRWYGDHTVYIYKDILDEDGKPQRLTLRFENYEHQAQAEMVAKRYQELFSNDPSIKVEAGYKYKAERDTSISLQQFLDTARRAGVEISQPERERLVKALISSESMMRSRLLRRTGVPGYAEDPMRTLHEFITTTSRRIAYNEFSSTMNDALDGKPVEVDVTNGVPTHTTDAARNLWSEDDQAPGPKRSGFYRNLANTLADNVLTPDQRGTWSGKLRAAAMMYFLGGSVASGVVWGMQVPMNTLPWLSMHTDYGNAFTHTFAASKMTLKNARALYDIPTLTNRDIPIPEIDSITGLRDGLIKAAEQGRTLDSQMNQIMGMANGAIFAKSRRVQKAMNLWMAPFRLTEQFSRITTFIAAHRVGLDNGLEGKALYDFASNVVDSTQNRYDEVNRPGMARDPVGAMLFMFKSFPLFMTEMVHAMYKQNPKSAAYMLLGLTAVAGTQGLPFAETIEDLVDTISQQLFNSPFNSRRAMRNMMKDATEALTGSDLSELVLRGGVNDMTGLSIGHRLGMGGFIPGTRVGAADSDYGRTARDLLGAPVEMVTNATSGAGALLKGDLEGAIRQGAPIEMRNLVKSAQMLDRGYSVDGYGRKLVNATGIEAFWQALGFTSAALNKAYEMDTIDRQSEAFYTQVRKDFTDQLVNAVKSGDASKAQDVMDAVDAWNMHYPNEPIGFSPEAIRRDVVMSGLPLNERMLLMLPKQLRGSSLAAEGIGNSQ
ncbi:MAG: PLxRFG domain-containing protein [Acidobacteriaceae bacterium]